MRAVLFPLKLELRVDKKSGIGMQVENTLSEASNFCNFRHPSEEKI